MSAKILKCSSDRDSQSYITSLGWHMPLKGGGYLPRDIFSHRKL